MEQEQGQGPGSKDQEQGVGIKGRKAGSKRVRSMSKELGVRSKEHNNIMISVGNCRQHLIM